MTSALDPLGRLLSASVAAGWMPGATWRVESAGATLSGGAVGNSSLVPEAEPAAEDTPYDLASLTKALATAPLLVLLEQDGLLELEDPVGLYVPELAGSPHAGTSLLALAAHLGGLPAWRPLYVEATELSGFLRQIAQEPAIVTPGRSVYSDLGYILLGTAIERAAGTPLAQLFDARIAQPLGLARLGFATSPDSFPDAAPTEQGNEYERAMAGSSGASYGWRVELLRGEAHDANARALGGVAGHAGLFGTAVAVARLARELLAPRLLPLGERGRARLLGVVDGSDGRTVGMVTARHSSAARGILPDGAPGHTGFAGTSLWLDPAAGRLFVLLTNRVHPRVSRRNFQLMRRAFHRLAQRMAASA